MASGIPDKVMKVKRYIHVAEVVVKKTCVGVAHCPVEFRSNRLHIVVGLHSRLRNEFQEPSCLADFLGRSFETRGLEAHHAAHQIAEMIPWVSIVTNVSDPLRTKHFAANAQEAFPNRLRNPRVDSVSNNKVEFAELLLGCLTKVH